MDEIIKLQEKIQECKTRLKALQVSQSNYSALSAIKLYFKDIQEFLNLINNNYSSHIEECNSHTILIADLQDQILAINQTLQNLPDSEDIDLSSITSSIQTLTNNLEILQQELTDYKEENEINFNLISTDISTIQTELAILNEKAFDMEEEVTSINNSIGAINTNISNLTTAQNNLTSTQNNLSSTVSGIDNRLSTAESNISALTGGIDVGELDDRISNIETQSFHRCIIKNSYSMFLNVTPQTPFYSLFYYYKLDSDTCVFQKFNLKYTSSATGTLNVTLLQNGVETKTLAIDLSVNPSSYEFEYVHIPTSNSQNFQFLFNSTENVSFDGFDAVFIGKNLELFETDKNLKIECCDNKILVTKYDNHKIYVGIFDSKSNLNFDTENLTDMTSELYPETRSAAFGVKFKVVNNKLTLSKYLIASELATNGFATYSIFYNNPFVTDGGIGYSSAKDFSSVKVLNTHEDTTHIILYDYKPAYFNSVAVNIKTLENLDTFNMGKWYFATLTQKMDDYNNSRPRSTSNLRILAYNEDGFAYVILNNPVTKIVKIGLGGKFATAYYKSDGGTNIYINRMNTTDKYSMYYNSETKDYDVTLEETITDCDCVYETYDGARVLHKSTGWVIENV